MPIDYTNARHLLESDFERVEASLLQNVAPQMNEDIISACDTIFSSRTQAYREALLGCLIAKIQDSSTNVRLPYASQGPNAFNGRTLDEQVVNPFLHDKQIPSSRGPYLAVFRRSVQFDESVRTGLRDRAGFDAFLRCIEYIENAPTTNELQNLLEYLLYRFAVLREESRVSVSRLQRISLEQYATLLSGLLSVPSGGRIPVLLAVATFKTIKEFFTLDDWSINWQGINVADTASGAGGDITITKGGVTLMAIEVTERPIDRRRVVATFTTKIAPSGIEDYLFLIKPGVSVEDARQQAHRYFAQGHDINFVEIKDWILMVLATMGSRGRTLFNQAFMTLLESQDTPSAIRAIWNEQISGIVSG